jgi:hypothetical protein
MSWGDFLKTRLLGVLGPDELDPPKGAALILDDSDYQFWLRHVAAWISKHNGKPYLLHEDEKQWAERAAFDGVLEFAPNENALVIGAEGPPSPIESERAPFEIWLSNVQRYFERSTEPYVLAADERAWAEQWIKAGAFEWEIEPVSIRLRSAKPPNEGPYR